MNKNTVGYIVIIALFLVTSFFSLNLFLKQRAEKDLLNVNTFPMRIGEWEGKDLGVTEKEYDILDTRNLITREYTNRQGEKIYLFIIYSETNRSVFHPPEVCLIGSGVEILNKTTEKITMKDKDFFVNKLCLGSGKPSSVILYCYKAANLYTHNFYLQQAYFALHQLFGRRTQGATIRVSMLIRHDEKTTLATLKSFLAQTAEIVDSLEL